MSVGENRVKTGRLIWVVLVFFLLAPGELFAQSSVDSRVQKLEETIQVLERRVASLEDQLRQQNASAPVAAGKVNWRKLHQGMSEHDVEQLLGSPWKVDAFGHFTVWRYEYSFGDTRAQGEVDFNDRQIVQSWHEP